MDGVWKALSVESTLMMMNIFNCPFDGELEMSYDGKLDMQTRGFSAQT
jgi:hypothetical protein